MYHAYIHGVCVVVLASIFSKADNAHEVLPLDGLDEEESKIQPLASPKLEWSTMFQSEAHMFNILQ